MIGKLTVRPQLAALTVALAVFAGACGSDGNAEPQRPMARGLIILGADGMDPNLAGKLMREGRLPNLAKLAKKGQFFPLGTSTPPQSPVAWSEFVTGTTGAQDGIFDFIHRDPHTMTPYLSTSRTKPGRSLDIGPFAIPISSGKVELLRKGRAFWQILDDHGVPATILKVPANFPPPGKGQNRVMSGMGTPDILGTYGTFHVFTDDPSWIGRKVSSGEVHRLDFHGGQRAHAELPGPPDPMAADRHPLTLPVEVIADRARGVALIRIGDAEVMLKPGEWSRWIHISYDPGILGSAISGEVRLHLRSLTPHVFLYMSPVNMDPLDPAMPISVPNSFAAKLARHIGRYYTQGMPLDTKALTAGALTDAEFVEQGNLIVDERERMLHYALEHFHGGVLYLYISSTDLMSHMMWRALEPNASAHDRKFADAIPHLYERVDHMVGEIMKHVGPKTQLIVMSDHGFTAYLHQVHLNSWLAQQGYLTVRNPPSPGPLGNIDWNRTEAYALGLNELFLNLKGREEHGVVDPADREELLDQLTNDLEQFRDPDTGQRVIRRVYRPDPAKYPDRAPDLIIEYSLGYRSSDESALGGVDNVTVSKNHDKWSGDHCMDPALVPGVFFTSAPLARKKGSLLDLAPTILNYFGIKPPSYMKGHPLINPPGVKP